MASGDTLVVFTPLHNEPPSASAATIDTRNQHPVLDFDASNNEFGVFSGVMPQHYSGSGVDCLIHFSMSTATSGCIDLNAAFEKISACSQDIDSDGFAAANTAMDVPVPGTSGYITSACITFTDGADMDSVGAGDGFRIKIARNGPTDGATGDAELRYLEIREA